MRILFSLAALTMALAACSASQGQAATRPSSGTQAPAAAPSAPASSSAGVGAPASSSGAAAAPASTSETCTFSRPGSGPGSTRVVSAAASDDTLTLTFDAGVPSFQATPQSNSRFILSPSGLPASLAGSAGVMIRFTGLTMGAYGDNPRSFSTSGPLLLQVRNLEDFEGAVSFGAGLSSAGCASASVSGSTVTFHFLQSGKG